MFDQSLLLDRGGTRKAGALATSFVAQMLAAGVLLLGPLLYRETLPLRVLMAADYYPLHAAPQPAAAKSSPETKGSSFNARPVFRAPARDRIATSQTASAGISMEAPALDFGLPQADSTQPRIAPLPEMTPPPKPPAPVAEIVQQPVAPIRVSQGVLAAKLIRKVVPVYPPLARQARIQGTVRLVGIVDRDGTIQQLRVLSGHPLLVEAALAAVRQWVYQPTLLNGEPVQVLAPIDVTFTLAQ
ncbi:MAG TPA: energy transducer TonB [Bryobacteraceae bacterium]|nr:energy transducer TonB [Bryobacteraceae bacterium]